MQKRVIMAGLGRRSPVPGSFGLHVAVLPGSSWCSTGCTGNPWLVAMHLSQRATQPAAQAVADAAQHTSHNSPTQAWHRECIGLGFGSRIQEGETQML